jgi:protein-S-isoprenylcysteine O-methyltransferase Ste14
MSLYLSPESVLGWCMAIGGTLLRVWCYKTLAKAFTFEPSVKEGHELVRSGPYKYVRHPSYTGYYILMVGAALLTYGRGSWWASVGFGLGVWRVLAMAHISWQMILASSFWGRCDLEDRVLHDHFQEQWEQWAHDVPCKVIPGVI